ncbi:hypothetical protein NTH35_001813 [Vibrio fluvialis]|nr:hypothetical protein [Vibrio fluvialis]EKO3446912.1 hypothetical protein [Vibrio fluvialis]ELG2962633.1 hypothetical protein [Vibrio fluvialis]
MSGPINDAKSGQTKDAQDPAGTCPLKQSKLQLIPVRYALVESPPHHQAVSSRLKSEVLYRPIGIRPIDSGYLYIIHSRRKDIIYVYNIQADGKVLKLEQQQLEDGCDGQEYIYIESEQGLFVARDGNIEVLFSETKISPKLQSHLLNSESLRKKMMQTCNVEAFNCSSGSRHLLPTTALNDNLADCEPEKSNNEEEYRWCWLEEKPQPYQSKDLLSHIIPEYEKDAAILILEDPIRVMTDLSSCNIRLNKIEEEWFSQDDNRAKYFAASQIKLIIEVGERYFNANTNNKKLKNHIESNLKEIKERFHCFHDADKAYWDFVRSKTAGHAHYSLSVESLQNSPEYKEYQKQRLLNYKMAQNIGITQNELEAFFRQVKKQNDKVVKGEFDGWLGDRGILARIEHYEMEEWFKSTQRKIDAWRQQTDIIERDQSAVRPFAYDVIAVFDKESKDAFVARLIHENHWLEISPEHLDHLETLRDFFFGTIGEQNLHTFFSNSDKIGTIDNKYANGKEWLQYLAPAKGVKDNAENTINGLSGLKDFQDMLKGHHLIEIDDVPDEVKKQLNRLGSKLSSLALDELNEISKNLHASQARANSLIYHARPGVIATLLVHRKNANIILDVGDHAGIDYFNQYFTQLEHNRVEAENILTKRKSMEKSAKGLTKADRDDWHAYYNRQLKILGDDSQHALMMLAASSEPLAKEGQAHLPSQITVKASGATAKDIDDLLALRQKVLRNELLYGISEGKSFKGAVGSGSAALVIFALNAWNWSNTQQALAKKSSLTRFQWFEYTSGLTGLLSASTSVVVEITKLKASLDWINTPTDLTKNVLGKVITIGTTSVFALTFVSSFTDMLKQGNRMSQSWRKGDFASFVSSSIAFIGSGTQTFASGTVATYGGKQVLSAAAKRITWITAAENTFGIMARANPWVLGASLLLLVGEVGYNFLQSTPLMNWVSQSSWGKDGVWFWHKNQHWDYTMQFTKWLEATQAPSVSVCTETYQTTLLSASGNWATQVTKYRVKTLRLIVPMTIPKHIKLAGYVKALSNAEPINITHELIQNSRVIYDGMNTVYEFDWPQERKRQENLRYLDLMIEVTSQYGSKLFEEQGGARFTLDLHNPVSQDKQEWHNVDLLDEDDEQSVSQPRLVSSLMSLVKK